MRAKGIKGSFLHFLFSDGILSVKGYDSVNLPSGLYKRVKTLVKTRDEFGYRSVTEFVAESVRKRLEEIDRMGNYPLKVDKNSQL